MLGLYIGSNQPIVDNQILEERLLELSKAITRV